MNPSVTDEECPSLPLWNWYVQLSGGPLLLALLLFLNRILYHQRIPKEPKEPKDPTAVEMKTISVDLKAPSTTAPDKKESIYTSKV